MRRSVTLFFFLFFPLDAFADTPTPQPSIENHLSQSVDPPVNSKPEPPCTGYDLHVAVQIKGTACLQKSLQHMDVNDRDVNGDTPLHNAIHLENGAAIKFLILNGADIHELDFEGRNAVQLANILGKQRLYDFLAGIERETERLLEFIDNDDVVGVSNSLHRGASLGMTDTRLDTPLHRAAESGVSDVGLLLVHHGANIEARNYLGETALMTATLREQPEFAKMLIESGANVNALDERRRTPLDIAESKDNQSMMALLAKKKSRHGAAASVEFDFEAAEGGLDSAKQ